MATHETDVLSKETFPTVLACAEPPFDTSVLVQHGYAEIFRYTLGVLGTPKSGEELKFAGWSGNGTIVNSTELLDELTLIRSERDIGAYELDKFPSFLFANRRMAEATYPLGRCVQVSHKKGNFKNSLQIIPKLPTSVKVIVRDPVHGAHFGEQPSEMKGDKIVGKEGSRRKYRIKIQQTIYEDDDPEHECSRYAREQSFDSCVREKISNTLLPVLGCLPPLFAFAGNQNETCQNNFVFDSEERNRNVTDAMVSILGLRDAQICDKPCTQTLYTATLLEELPSDRSRIQLDFDPTVDIVRIGFRINFQTFLTRLGGAVSFGRTGLWIFVSTIDGCILAWKFTKTVLTFF